MRLNTTIGCVLLLMLPAVAQEGARHPVDPGMSGSLSTREVGGEVQVLFHRDRSPVTVQVLNTTQAGKELIAMGKDAAESLHVDVSGSLLFALGGESLLRADVPISKEQTVVATKDGFRMPNGDVLGATGRLAMTVLRVVSGEAEVPIEVVGGRARIGTADGEEVLHVFAAKAYPLPSARFYVLPPPLRAGQKIGSKDSELGPRARVKGPVWLIQIPARAKTWYLDRKWQDVSLSRVGREYVLLRDMVFVDPSGQPECDHQSIEACLDLPKAGKTAQEGMVGKVGD